MKKQKVLVFFMALSLMLTGCGDSGKNKGSSKENAISSGESINNNFESDIDDSSDSSNVDLSYVEINTEDMFSNRDYDASYNESKSTVIQLNGASATCSSNAVTIDGNIVTITDEGTYIIRGTLDDGMIIVNAGEDDKPHLVLDGVKINSETSAPIYIFESDKVFITLADGSTNTLSNGGTFEAIDKNNIDSVIFSKQDLTINGSGTLTVSSPSGHGIVSKDDLVLTGGNYDITTASHGISANDSVRIVDSTINIASGKDGIQAENSDDATLGFVYILNGTFEISAEGDGISAGVYMQIEDGTFNILAGGGSINGEQHTSSDWGGYGGGQGGPGDMPGGGGPGNPGDRSGTTDTFDSNLTITDSVTANVTSADDSSTSIKGLKATGNLIINGGAFNIDSADDSIHSDASITIVDGIYSISSGDDAFHGEENLTISGGTIDVITSYEGLEALNVLVSGGNINIVSTDDGLNAAGGMDQSGFGGARPDEGMGMSGASNGSVVITGGELYINASGDGIDANGYLEITGGMTVVCGPTMGDTAVLDYDTTATITGGTFIGTGASMMAQTFSDSTQGVMGVSVGSQEAGTLITITDSEGKEIVSYEPALDFQIVVISTPDMIKGETYKITVGSAEGEFAAD